MVFSVDVDKHGDRVEVRKLQSSTALNDYLKWPGLQQVCRIEREVTRRGKTTCETAFAITSLRTERYGAAELLAINRGHWGIENRLHYVRDVTMGEDACRVRSGMAPQALAIMRNIAIALLRDAGNANIAAALRRCAARPREALKLVGIEGS
jgi:predicted transposase YbfD/YdcC